MSNFMSNAKKKRELAKLDKRLAKEQRRAVRKAERSADLVASATAITPAPPARAANHRPGVNTALGNKPLTLSEAVERWRNTKIGKPKRR